MRRPARFASLPILALLCAARPAHALPPVPAEFAGHVDYVVVTTGPLAAAFQPLADWKTQSGVRAVLHTLAAIHADYPAGRDDAERVRMFLKDAYALAVSMPATSRPADPGTSPRSRPATREAAVCSTLKARHPSSAPLRAAAVTRSANAKTAAPSARA